MKNLCPTNCEHLSLTEEEQNSIRKLGKPREYHFCTKFQKQVHHEGWHPRLVQLDECKEINNGKE